ncbi:Uncharacterised protein [uncultured archaeon]|nr:Uncharacterised protein [uncultured archaeon]
MPNKEHPGLDELISPQEREHLLFGLHRFLTWVGEPLPESVEVDGKKIEIQDLIWSCIHKKELSETEKMHLMELIQTLESKERFDEESLKKASLTQEEARALFHESAAFIRAIVDLKECEAGKVRLINRDDDLRKKINDAKKWMEFLKTVGKK